MARKKPHDQHQRIVPTCDYHKSLILKQSCGHEVNAELTENTPKYYVKTSKYRLSGAFVWILVGQFKEGWELQAGTIV